MSEPAFTATAHPLPTSVPALYAEASDLYSAIAEGDLQQLERGRAAARCSACLTALQLAIAQEGIFSPNERIEDIDTEDLPLLATDFLLGSLHIKAPFHGPTARLQAIEKADALLTHYLTTCERIHVLKEADLLAWRRLEAGESPYAPEQAREMKIARFKRQRASEKRLQEISSSLRAAAAVDAGDSSTGGSSSSSVSKHSTAAAAAAYREGLSRESHILSLESYARETLDELSTLVKEKEMLQHMLLTAAGSSTSSNSSSNDQRIRPSESSGEQSRNGLEVTHLSKVGGQLHMQKEVVRARVFQPTIAPPTMSLEEFAEIEYADAMARAEREKNAPQADRRYEQLHAEGLEDNEELSDIAAVKDRAWDDWKDEHPRGYGNKANKRF